MTLAATSEFNNIKVNGDIETLRFQAKSTATITSGTWKALHIELPPVLRIDGKQLPSTADNFIDLLSETITEICI